MQPPRREERRTDQKKRYPGQVINSDIGSTIMEMVPGPVAMVGFLGEVG